MIGLSLSDTYRLTLEEFNILYAEWDAYRTALYRSSWEQSRFVAHCSLMPHARRGLRPTDLVRFEWDGDRLPAYTPATRRDFDRIRERFGE